MRNRFNKKGQIAILIALAFGLIFLLIAMVVNIGFLVAAKINLQNSVDMAAYAGAAQQARYLTEIGKWNYEMRRNYKAMSFDYMVAMNAERNQADFKDYMTSSNITKVPVACASLQRQGSQGGLIVKSKLCQNAFDANDINIASILQKSEEALNAGSLAAVAACTGDPTSDACNSATSAAGQQIASDKSLKDLASDESMKYGNYEDKSYNYNRRLIGWMLHDYRHLQSRIRGVHFGNIDIGKYDKTGRWTFIKEKTTPVIFNNAPISVAAKVLNGYTNLNGPAPNAGQPMLLDTNGQSLKNPIHNAAYETFKRNLLEIISDKAQLYHLVPSAASSSNNITLQEFSGPYLRLNNHDVSFFVRYILIKKASPDTYQSFLVTPQRVTNFPIGVAKDNRVMTYYTVVGVASTGNIPFNVFFGSGQASQEPSLVAVAAARPFGSRIGPFIDNNCDDLYNPSGGDPTACTKNGLDPLYPFFKGSSPKVHPNFSITDKDKTLGVKLSMSQTEYNPSTDPSFPVHVEAYSMTYDGTGRSRNYLQPDGTNQKDDGFNDRNQNVNEPGFFDNDDVRLHPMGTKDSVIAWSSIGTTQLPPSVTTKVDSYEGYLEKYATAGGAILQLPQVPERKTTDGEYKVYVFRYPAPKNNEWDINGLTTRTDNTRMEKAFANAMAVSSFELIRYILPYKNTSGQQSSTLNSALNYVTDQSNYMSQIFTGSSKRVGTTGSDNQPASTFITSEGAEVLGINTANDVFAESYAAWRTGTRGYRVKLMNIHDLLAGGTNTSQNLLSNTYTIPLPEGDMQLDLSKINY